MDIVLALLVMAALYLLPELWRRRGTEKKYDYPDIPASLPEQERTAEVEIHQQSTVLSSQEPPSFNGVVGSSGTVAAAVWTGYAGYEVEPEGANAKPETDMAPAVSKKSGLNALWTPWSGKLTSAQVLNGLIWAEIVAPPKSRRLGLLRRN